MAHQHSLHDKLAIVTGAASGIGAEAAVRLGAKGACVVVNYKDAGQEQGAKDVAQRIKDAGGKAECMQADLTDLQQLTAMVQKTLKLCGEGHQHIDILVNCAGQVVHKTVAELTEADFDRMFATDVKGPFFLCKEVVKHMPEGGRIINMGASFTIQPHVAWGVYMAAKGAVEQLTKALAKEMGSKGITVNTVSAGPVDTGMFQTTQEQEDADKAIKNTPLGRLGKPDDIADVIAFLCTSKARWITGQNLQVNGGIAMQ